MAAFLKSTFNTASYASSRPTYPRQLFDMIFRYHETSKLPIQSPSIPGSSSLPRANPRWDRAVDLGCGTGQATIELTPFRHIIGVDPSAKMVSGAREYANSQTISVNKLEFVQSPAEELGFLQNDSVDLMIAAQAAHWFNWNKMWPEAHRVLRSGGTFAFWIYSEFRLPSYPQLTPLITRYAQGSDPHTSIGPHWEQPGRSILDKHLVDIPDPKISDGWEATNRIYFTGKYHPDLPTSHTLPPILRKRMTWNELLGYFRTFSALHTFHEKFPEDNKREDGSLEVRFWKELMKEAGVPSEAEGGGEEFLEVEWPVAIVLARKS